MKRKLILLATLAFIVGVAFAKVSGLITFGSLRESTAPRTGSSSPAEWGALGTGPASATLPAACTSPEDISNAMRKLSSEDGSEGVRAQTYLMSKSKESQTCRVEIISALMKAMDKPNLDFMEDEESYHLWLRGAQLLGDLKATEAIDLLVSHLGLINDGAYSMSMRHQPALLGLIKMGEIAIPKLDEVLRHNPDWRQRHYAVFCIATIGGPQAINSLSQAVGSEPNQCVSRFIKISLDSFDDQGRIKNRLEWFRGVSCN